MQITSSNQLPRLLEEVHDRYIDIDQHEYLEKLSVLRLPRVGRKSKLIVERPDPDTAEGYIDFHRVQRFIIDDTNQIRYYSVDTIQFDEIGSTIVLQADPTLEVSLWVDELDIRLVS